MGHCSPSSVIPFRYLLWLIYTLTVKGSLRNWGVLDGGNFLQSDLGLLRSTSCKDSRGTPWGFLMGPLVVPSATLHACSFDILIASNSSSNYGWALTLCMLGRQHSCPRSWWFYLLLPSAGLALLPPKHCMLP